MLLATCFLENKSPPVKRLMFNVMQKEIYASLNLLFRQIILVFNRKRLPALRGGMWFLDEPAANGNDSP